MTAVKCSTIFLKWSFIYYCSSFGNLVITKVNGSYQNALLVVYWKKFLFVTEICLVWKVLLVGLMLKKNVTFMGTDQICTKILLYEDFTINGQLCMKVK